MPTVFELGIILIFPKVLRDFPQLIMYFLNSDVHYVMIFHTNIQTGGDTMYIRVDEELEIRLLDLKDAGELFRLTDESREHLREWLAWVDTTVNVADSRAFIEHTLRAREEKKGLTAGVFYQGVLVGTAGFNRFDWTNKIGSIGYWLSEKFQGHGIMTRVAEALTDYAFNTLQLNRVGIRAAFENKKSRAIPERLGFVEEGQLRQAEWLYDHYVDHVVYGMLANEWVKH